MLAKGWPFMLVRIDEAAVVDDVAGGAATGASGVSRRPTGGHRGPREVNSTINGFLPSARSVAAGELRGGGTGFVRSSMATERRGRLG